MLDRAVELVDIRLDRHDLRSCPSPVAIVFQWSFSLGFCHILHDAVDICTRIDLINIPGTASVRNIPQIISGSLLVTVFPVVDIQAVDRYGLSVILDGLVVLTDVGGAVRDQYDRLIGVGSVADQLLSGGIQCGTDVRAGPVLCIDTIPRCFLVLSGILDQIFHAVHLAGECDHTDRRIVCGRFLIKSLRALDGEPVRVRSARRDAVVFLGHTPGIVDDNIDICRQNTAVLRVVCIRLERADADHHDHRQQQCNAVLDNLFHNRSPLVAEFMVLVFPNMCFLYSKFSCGTLLPVSPFGDLHCSFGVSSSNSLRLFLSWRRSQLPDITLRSASRSLAGLK